MIYLKGFTSFLLVMIISCNSLAEEFRSTLVGFSECDKFPVDMDMENMPMFCFGNSSIAFLIQGEGIIALKEETLLIDKLTLEGKDISQDRMGNHTYKISPFPNIKISDSGRYLVFQLEVNPPKFGHLQKIKLDASIDVVTSDKYSIDIEKNINLSKPFSINMGPYKVTNHSLMNDVITDENLLAVELSQIFNRTHPMDRFELDVSGNLDALIGLEIVDGENRMLSSRFYSSNDKKTLSFEIPSKRNMTLELKYWKDLKEITVPFRL